jgi:hypothetical protein
MLTERVSSILGIRNEQNNNLKNIFQHHLLFIAIWNEQAEEYWVSGLNFILPQYFAQELLIFRFGTKYYYSSDRDLNNSHAGLRTSNTLHTSCAKCCRKKDVYFLYTLMVDVID